MAAQKKVLILGGYGFLGTYLSRELRSRGNTVLIQGRSTDAEISWSAEDAGSLEVQLDKHKPDVLINLIAETNVDKCELDPLGAYLSNAKIVDLIGQAITAYGQKIRFIHISSDQVYSGKGPHKEESVCPANVYALSKYTGELLAHQVNGVVLRTNFVGKSENELKPALSDWIVNSVSSKKTITVFEDVLFSPLHIQTLSEIIGEVADADINGVFNVGAGGGVTKAEFAFELVKQIGLDTQFLQKGKQSDVQLKARRPFDMQMDTNRFENAFKLKLPTITEEIKKLANQYK